MDFTLPEIDTRERANAGVDVTLTKLDGLTPLLNAKKEPVTLTMLGADSDEWRKVQRALTRARIERAQKKGRETTTDEMLDLADREDIDALAQMVKGWSGILDTKDKPVDFSHDNVVDLFTKFPVAREQAEKAFGERTRFIRPS